VFSFAPAQDFNGTASFTFRVVDRGDPDGCVAGPGCDGQLSSVTRTFTIDVTPVNDAPVAVDGSGSVVEDGVSLPVDLRGLVSDVETADADLSYLVVAGPAAAAGSLLASAVNGVFSFAPAQDFNGTASFTFRVVDRGDPDGCVAGSGCDDPLSSVTRTFTIDVTPVNDAPVITSNGGGATAVVSVPEGTTSATDVNATDPDPGATLTYSIGGGADAGAFSIDSASGVLSFLTAPNFEAPGDSNQDNVYEVDVVVSDGTLADAQALRVTVTDVLENQAPVITSNGGGATAAVSVVENTTAVTDVDATDPNPADTLTYSIDGGADAGRFQINGSTGVLSFAAAPDFEAAADANGDNAYEVVVSASDGLLAAVQEISVTVTNADETPANRPPVITSGGGADTAETQLDEGTTGVGTVVASDPEGASVSYAISGGTDAALLTLDPGSGALSFIAAPDYEHPADGNADNAYQVDVEVSDGSLTDVQSLVVRVRDVNEHPTALLPSGLVTDEDVALVLRSANGQAMSISDPDAAAAAVRVSLSVAAGTLMLPRKSGLSFEVGDGSPAPNLTFTGSIADVDAALGDVVFAPAANAYGIVTLVLVAADPAVRGLSEESSTAIVVRPVNDPPVLEPISDVRARPGTVVAFTASASDIDGIRLTYSIDRAPAGAQIDPTTGAFLWTPTTEQAPGPLTFDVVVDDGGAPDLSDRVAVTITLTEPPAPSAEPPPARAPTSTPSTPAAGDPAPPKPVQARDDSARVMTREGVTIAVLENDVIPAGTSVTVTAGPAEHGTVRVLADGSILYTPEPGFEGTDGFPYTISGPDGRSSAMVEVVVEIPQPVVASWLGGPLLGGSPASSAAAAPPPPPSALNTGFLVMARVLLETVQGLDTPVRLLAIAGAWFGLFAASLAVFRRRRAFIVDGVSRDGVLDVLDRPEGERRYRLRYDDGPVWSVGRRRRVHGRTWVPVSTRAGSGFVELDRLLALDRAVDSPRGILQG
jgi:hypothetical protein